MLLLYITIIPIIIFIVLGLIDKLRNLLFDFIYKTKFYVSFEKKLGGVKID